MSFNIPERSTTFFVGRDLVGAMIYHAAVGDVYVDRGGRIVGVKVPRTFAPLVWEIVRGCCVEFWCEFGKRDGCGGRLVIHQASMGGELWV